MLWPTCGHQTRHRLGGVGSRTWQFLFGTTAARALPPVGGEGRRLAQRGGGARWGDTRTVTLWCCRGRRPNSAVAQCDGTSPTSIHQLAWTATSPTSTISAHCGSRVATGRTRSSRSLPHPAPLRAASTLRRQRAGGWELAAALCSNHSPSICNCPGLRGVGSLQSWVEFQNERHCRGKISEADFAGRIQKGAKAAQKCLPGGLQQIGRNG